MTPTSPSGSLAAVTGVAISLFAAAGCGAPQPEFHIDLVIRNVTVVDVETGELREQQRIEVVGDRIAAVEPDDLTEYPPASGDGAFAAGRTTLEFDGGNAFVIPGLWDMHVHVLWDSSFAAAAMPLFIANGVTGVRDMGGPLEALKLLEAPGPSWPQVVASGPILDGPQPVDPSASLAVGTPEEARRAVDRVAAAGADFIKVYTLLPPEAYRAAVERAGELGLPVAGHLPGGVRAADASRFGQRSIEHLRDELIPFCMEPGPACDELVQVFAENRTYQAPTLVILRAKAYIPERAYAEDSRLAFIPAQLRDDWLAIREHRIVNRNADYFAEKRIRYAAELEATRILHKGGVPILAGTDVDNLFSMPGFSLHDELALMVQAGLSPLEALRTATHTPARYLERETEMGAIRVGFVADMVLLDANPVKDIRNTTAIRAVVRAGLLFNRVALDGMLEQARVAAGDWKPP